MTLPFRTRALLRRASRLASAAARPLVTLLVLASFAVGAVGIPVVDSPASPRRSCHSPPVATSCGCGQDAVAAGSCCCRVKVANRPVRGCCLAKTAATKPPRSTGASHSAARSASPYAKTAPPRHPEYRCPCGDESEVWYHVMSEPRMLDASPDVRPLPPRHAAMEVGDDSIEACAAPPLTPPPRAV